MTKRRNRHQSLNGLRTCRLCRQAFAPQYVQSISLADSYTSPSGAMLPPGKHPCCLECREELRDEFFADTVNDSPNREALNAMARQAVSVRQVPAIDMSREEERDQQIRISKWLNEIDPTSDGKLPSESQRMPTFHRVRGEAKAPDDARMVLLYRMGLTRDHITVLSHRLSGYTNAEVGVMTGKTVNQVDKLFRKAMRKLPAHIKERLSDKPTASHHRRRLVSISETGMA